MSTPRTEGESVPPVAQTGTTLEQVRELLFGQPQRELERKLARIEAHLSVEGDDIRKEMRRRLEDLQAHAFKEIEALAGRLESERSAQLDAVSALARDAHGSIATLEQRLGRLEEALARTQRDVRQQILDQSKQFIEELQSVKAEMVRTLEHELSSYASALGAVDGYSGGDGRRAQLEGSSEQPH